jgi:hypothetical protein
VAYRILCFSSVNCLTYTNISTWLENTRKIITLDSIWSVKQCRCSDQTTGKKMRTKTERSRAQPAGHGEEHGGVGGRGSGGVGRKRARRRRTWWRARRSARVFLVATPPWRRSESAIAGGRSRMRSVTC